jgi:hypothetical protein
VKAAAKVVELLQEQKCTTRSNDALTRAHTTTKYSGERRIARKVCHGNNGPNGLDVHVASRVFADALARAGLPMAADLVSVDDHEEHLVVRLSPRQARDVASVIVQGATR